MPLIVRGLFAVLILTALSACSSKPYVVKPIAGLGEQRIHKVYIANHGWHTGFVVPAADIYLRLPKLKERFGSAAYLEFGWGDKDFYQADQVTSGLALRAVFWPTDSVVRVVSRPLNVEDYFSYTEFAKLCLTKGEYSAVIAFLVNSFFRNEQGDLIMLKSEKFGNAQFYEGEGTYYMLNTCNTWTAKGLKSAGMDIMPMFKLTARSIMDYLQEHKQAHQLDWQQHCYAQ